MKKVSYEEAKKAFREICSGYEEPNSKEIVGNFIAQHQPPTFDEVVKAWEELSLYSKKYNKRIQIFSHSFGKILDIGAGENKVQIYKNEFSQFVHYDFFKAINLTIRYLESQKEKNND